MFFRPLRDRETELTGEKINFIIFILGLPHRLHLQASFDQGGGDEAEERRRSSSGSLIPRISSRRRTALQRRVLESNAN